MDAAAREKAGAAPLSPTFATIAKLKTADDLPAVLAELHLSGANAGFGFRVAQDARNSTRYIGIFNQGGLGLPDRDYYLKEDPKSKDLREAYRAHVAKMLELVGDAPETAKAEADVVMAIETKLAQVSITRVENRDPQKTYNKRTVAALERRGASVSISRGSSPTWAPRRPTEVNVRQPVFFKGFAALAALGAARRLAHVPALARRAQRGAVPLEGLPGRGLRLQRKEAERHAPAGGALAARASGDGPRRSARRSARSTSRAPSARRRRSA